MSSETNKPDMAASAAGFHAQAPEILLQWIKKNSEHLCAPETSASKIPDNDKRVFDISDGIQKTISTQALSEQLPWFKLLVSTCKVSSTNLVVDTLSRCVYVLKTDGLLNSNESSIIEIVATELISVHRRVITILWSSGYTSQDKQLRIQSLIEGLYTNIAAASGFLQRIIHTTKNKNNSTLVPVDVQEAWIGDDAVNVITIDLQSLTQATDL